MCRPARKKPATTLSRQRGKRGLPFHSRHANEEIFLVQRQLSAPIAAAAGAPQAWPFREAFFIGKSFHHQESITK
jgi:hypothetical protein